MKKIILVLFILSLQCCQNKDKNVIKKDVINKKIILFKENNEAQLAVVKGFMKWYIQNINTIYKFNTIGGGPANAPENGEAENYFVNFQEVEKYITELKKSGFLGDEILKKEKQAFIDGEKYFKENPENDSPPYGFDYDHFFLTQDTFEEDLPNIDKIKYKINQVNDFNAEVEFYLPTSDINLNIH